MKALSEISLRANMWLRNDEWVSPLVLIVCGLGGLLIPLALSRFSEWAQRNNIHSFETVLVALSERMEARKKISWVATIAGILWLAESVIFFR